MDVNDPETQDAHPEPHRPSWQDSHFLFDEMLQYITTLQHHRDHLINTLHHRDQEIQDLCYTVHKAECQLWKQHVRSHLYKDLMETMVSRLETELQSVKDVHCTKVKSLEEELRRMSRLLVEERRKNIMSSYHQEDLNTAGDVQLETSQLRDLIQNDVNISEFEETLYLTDDGADDPDLDLNIDLGSELGMELEWSLRTQLGALRETDQEAKLRRDLEGDQETDLRPVLEPDLNAEQLWREKIRALEVELQQKLTEKRRMLEENEALQEGKLLWDGWEYGGQEEDKSEADPEEDGEKELKREDKEEDGSENKLGWFSRFFWTRKK